MKIMSNQFQFQDQGASQINLGFVSYRVLNFYSWCKMSLAYTKKKMSNKFLFQEYVSRQSQICLLYFIEYEIVKGGENGFSTHGKKE